MKALIGVGPGEYEAVRLENPILKFGGFNMNGYLRAVNNFNMDYHEKNF